MRVNEARTPRFRHGLVLCDGFADTMIRLGPPVAAAARRGDLVALAVSDAVAAGLGDLVGAEALDTLTPLTGAARRSAQTAAAWRARELRTLCSGGREVLVVAEHDPDLDGPDGSYWTEYEAALNLSLGGLPLTQVCAFPQLPLHQLVGDAALANHPFRLYGTELTDNPSHRSPGEVLATMPVAPPDLLGPPDVFLRYNAFELSRVRRTIEGVLRDHDIAIDESRGEDLVLAVNEIATNAVEHGSAPADLLVWASGDELVCELHDNGSLGLPLIGMAPPHPSQPRGRGTWIARQLCDSLHVWRDPSGTHVRLLARA